MVTVGEKVSVATIGSALAQRRVQLKLSRVQAADHIGMSRTTYSSYERDTQRPSVDVFPVLADFLDVSMDDFLVLYGATSIAAVRPSLERLLVERANPLVSVESVSILTEVEKATAGEQSASIPSPASTEQAMGTEGGGEAAASPSATAFDAVPTFRGNQSAPEQDKPTKGKKKKKKGKRAKN